MSRSSLSSVKFLEKKISPCFGVLVLFSTLILVMYYTSSVHIGPVTAREQSLTVLGFLPDNILRSEVIFLSLKGIVFLGVIFWAFHLALPISPWITLFSFTFLICQSIETHHYTLHMYHIVNVTLFACALWYTFDYQSLKKKDTAAALLRGGDVPYFVYFLPVYYLAVTYSFSGITKLYYSGFGWANGTSLQLWVFTLESSRSGLGELIISNNFLSKLLQIVVLFFETTAFLTLPFPALRPVYGLALMGFHISVEILFHLTFYGNILLDFLFLVAYPLFFERRHKVE